MQERFSEDGEQRPEIAGAGNRSGALCAGLERMSREGGIVKRRGEKLSLLERYLAVEIEIEFKACLYFFCILFFYSMYRLMCGSAEASILHMGEMIVLTYGMGYFQKYVLAGFDEADRMGIRETGFLFLCVGIYAAASYLGAWFDRRLPVTVFYAFYMALAYVCGFLVYKIKRALDAKRLNEDLRAFQRRDAAQEDGNS